MNKKILFISNVPSPYSVEYLNELGKLGEVTAVFERGYSSERDESWKSIHDVNFKCIILNGIHVTVDTAFSPGVLRYIHRNKNEHIIIGNPLTPTGILSILYCKAIKTPFILQSEGGIPKDGKGIKERFKKWLMKSATLYLSGMNPDHDYFLAYGAEKKQIISFPFASMYQKDICDRSILVPEKSRLKEELGISEDRIVLYVGRFIKLKGIDSLIKACAGISGIGLYMIGGKPTEEYIALCNEGNVKGHYIDHVDFSVLKKYYGAADVFVLPTHSDTWGLVINEAMSFGLPVITTDKCVAGVELIESGVNGFLVPVDGVEEMHNAIELLCKDDKLRAEMGQKNLEKIQSHSYEKMAATIFHALIDEDLRG